MPRSRLACRFAVLTVLVLHATCLETQNWSSKLAAEHDLSSSASAAQNDVQQALQASLDKALQSLMPDAAAAVLFNSAEATRQHLAVASDADAVTAPKPAAAAAAAAAAAPVAASEIIPMQTSHGLALPSQHMQQLQQQGPPGFEAALRESRSNGVDVELFDVYDENEDLGRVQEDYLYLEEPPRPMLFVQGKSEYAYGADAAAESALLPPQLPEGASSSSSSDDATLYSDPGMLTLQGDVMISSRMPVSSVLLQQSITQPLIELATDVARGVWQVFSSIEAAPSSMQQLQLPRPFRIQEMEATVESSSGSSSDLRSTLDASESDSSSTTSSSSSDADALEISVTVESSRPRPRQAVALRRKPAVVQETLDATAIAAAVLKALGRRGAADEQQQQQQLAEPVVQQQQVQEMIAELQATGTYEGELQASAKQLRATTAAAVAAAARALSSTAEPWDSMQMELEVTHTVQSKGCAWGHASLLVLAMVFANMGIFLLMAPWVSKIMGHAGGGGSSSNGDAKQPQFISAGLAEAGVYQKLLPEGGEV